MGVDTAKGWLSGKANSAFEDSEDCHALPGQTGDPLARIKSEVHCLTAAPVTSDSFITPFGICDNWSHTSLCNNLVVGKTFENANLI